ncbi:MAG: NAD-dependent epimerase/dehydratase family protein, partial [Actinomycetota bacterium]|nr:NAD-dependent epimerase/dehydratase family protein [Actinomycetota bacterium]
DGRAEEPPPVRARDVAEVLDAIDVAIVATPPWSHAMLATQLALAGKHVLLEKPVAATVGECVAIRDTAASKGVTVLPAHVRRFYPAAAWVAHRLASGELGTVRRVRWCEGADYAWPAVTGFTFDPGAGGGVLADLGPHVVDLLGHWFGALELRQCEDNSAGGADSETRLELRAGETGIEVELSRLRDLDNSVTIEGSQAALRVETRRAAGYEWRSGDHVRLVRGDVPAALPATRTRVGLFHRQLVEFDRALRGEPSAAATFDEAITTVELLERCRERRVHTLVRPWQAASSGPVHRAPARGARRVAVTGATGFIGSHVVERLLDEDATAVVVLARTPGRQARLSHADRARLDVVSADLLGDPAVLVEAFTGCDVVVHAAYGSAGEPALRWAVSVEGTAAVAAAARTAGVSRLVHVSSVSVYDAAATTVIDEDAPPLAAVPGDLSYAQQKLAAERLILDSADDRTEVVCVQPTVVYGPWGPLWTLRPLRRLAEDNTALPSGPSGHCDVVHVHDVADAIAFVASAPGAAGRRFLVSGPASTTWGEFYDRYRDMLSLPRLSLPDSARWPELDRRFYAGSPPVDTSRLVALGFRPRIGLDAGMDLLARWARWAGLT